APIRLSFEPNSAFTSVSSEYNGALGLASVPIRAVGTRMQIPWFKLMVNVDSYTDSQARSGQVEADRQLYTTLIHELGHGVGLDHTGHSSQIMYFADTPVLTEYGQGDLTGLRILGQSACTFNQVAGPSAPKTIKKSTTVHKQKKKRKKRKKRKHRSAQHRTYVADASQTAPVVRWTIHE
ncbi:MAG TPA: matrixin family metalloprotease, partial [Marmoricola sp.]|nr:matrixin family metalloprotease [Marmoricola sp.]